MSREVYDCLGCRKAHPVVRIPVPGRCWETKPHAVDCPISSPIEPSRIRFADDRLPELRSHLNSTT